MACLMVGGELGTCSGRGSVTVFGEDVEVTIHENSFCGINILYLRITFYTTFVGTFMTYFSIRSTFQFL
jgi:hypothetical protein